MDVPVQADKLGVLSVFPDDHYLVAGGVMSYGANRIDAFARAATFADKILRGAKPGSLPIERAAKFDFVVNLRAARALSVTIPQSLLLRADRVIE